MADEDAVRSLAKKEGEGIERPGRAHPREKVGPQITARLEPVGESLSHAGIDPVGDHHEIGVADDGIEWGDFAAVLDFNAQSARASAPNLQESRARTCADTS